MNVITQKIAKYVSLALDFIPTPLPKGMKEFDTWSTRIINNYGLPDNDSSRFALSTMILHLPSTSAYKSSRYFGLAGWKSMSNQIAAGVMQDLKAKQQQAQIEAAKQAEATAALTVDDVQPISN